MKISTILFLAAVSKIALPIPPNDRVDGAILVSIYSLISSPHRYENESLRLGGYWITGDELSLLCPQAVSASPLDCVELRFAANTRIDHALAGRAVRIDGRFLAPAGDNWTIYSGTITATKIGPALEIKDERGNKR